MNAKVARMLRKTNRDSHAGKRWWNSLSKEDRGQLRSDWDKLQNIQNGGTAKL